MLSFFVATTPHGVQMMTDMSAYLDFVMVLLLAFGLAFEVPVATVLLVWTGFVSLKTLNKNRGFVLLGIFIFAAFVTPPDAVSQSAMAVPMYLLYEIGIIMAGLLLKEKIAAREKEAAEQAQREAGSLSWPPRFSVTRAGWPRCSSPRCGNASPTTACARFWSSSWSPRWRPADSASTTRLPRRSTVSTPRPFIWPRCRAAGSPTASSARSAR